MGNAYGYRLDVQGGGGASVGRHSIQYGPESSGSGSIRLFPAKTETELAFAADAKLQAPFGDGDSTAVGHGKARFSVLQPIPHSGKDFNFFSHLASGFYGIRSSYFSARPRVGNDTGFSLGKTISIGRTAGGIKMDARIQYDALISLSTPLTEPAAEVEGNVVGNYIMHFIFNPKQVMTLSLSHFVGINNATQGHGHIGAFLNLGYEYGSDW